MLGDNEKGHARVTSSFLMQSSRFGFLVKNYTILLCVCACVCVCVFVLCVCFCACVCFVNLQEKRRLQRNSIASALYANLLCIVTILTDGQSQCWDNYRTCKSCTRVQIDLHSASRRLQHICCTAQRASVSLRKFGCTEVLQRPTKKRLQPKLSPPVPAATTLAAGPRLQPPPPFMFSPSPLLQQPSLSPLLQPWLSPLPLLWLQGCSLPSSRPWSLSFSSNGPFLATSTFCTLH